MPEAGVFLPELVDAFFLTAAVVVVVHIFSFLFLSKSLYE
jgi:hypothetical protein